MKLFPKLRKALPEKSPLGLVLKAAEQGFAEHEQRFEQQRKEAQQRIEQQRAEADAAIDELLNRP